MIPHTLGGFMTHWTKNFANYHILHENFELLGGASPLLLVVCVFAMRKINKLIKLDLIAEGASLIKSQIRLAQPNVN